MSYTLFIGKECPACHEVKTYLEDATVSFETVDLNEGQARPELRYVRIVPALFRGNKLLAYGTDIISYFKALDQTPHSA